MLFDDNSDTCPACGEVMRMETFHDEGSHLDDTLDGWCRRCRGLSELGHDLDEGFIRDGALVGHTAYTESVREICILPFDVPAPGAAVQWATRHIIRIGSNLLPLQPERELAPLNLSFDDPPGQLGSSSSTLRRTRRSANACEQSTS